MSSAIPQTQPDLYFDWDKMFSDYQLKHDPMLRVVWTQFHYVLRKGESFIAVNMDGISFGSPDLDWLHEGHFWTVGASLYKYCSARPVTEEFVSYQSVNDRLTELGVLASIKNQENHEQSIEKEREK